MALKYEKRNLENIGKLAAKTKAAALAWHEYLVANNINILIYETIRTEAQQRKNVASGASKTMKSYHLVGQALDFVPVDSKGNTLWNGYGSADAKKAIAKAKALGFEWGGDWKGAWDKPHLQYNYKGYGTDSLGGAASSGGKTSSGSSNNVSFAKNNIATIQTKLNQLYSAKLGVDGMSGPKTLKALVKGLQTELNKQYKANIAADGIWGPKTKAACKTVRKGAEGNISYLVQAALCIKGHNTNGVDGKFGAGTESAVKSFQKSCGLSADGIVGPNTFEKLFK